jgi:LuxR family maltose regulon positive regulatory protein
MVSAPEKLDLAVRRAKLRAPRAANELVARPRLIAQLDQSLRVPLTLVSAPAGFGKTTLLAEWAETDPAPLAWLSLDANDRDLKRFVTHLVASTESLVSGAGHAVLDLFRQSHLAAPSDIGAALADEFLDLPHDIVVILDNYQVAASTDVGAFLAGLHREPAPAFHLLLATRSDPALPLAHMRLRGQVSELRASDLRFTEEETWQLFVATGHLDVSPEIVAALHDQIGGWIAGLRLATLALPSLADLAPVAEVLASEQHLIDYLVEEVLASQSSSTQDFLLRTAICDQVCTSLADALMPEAAPAGGRETLGQLSRDSFFLEPTEDDGWFRYHPLFRSLLLHQIESRLAPPDIAGLHVRASAWYAEAGMLDAALRHLRLAGDMDGAAALVEARVLPALDREDWNAVADWLTMLPEPLIHARPRLLLAKAWVSHFSGRSVPIRAMFAELDALLANMDDEAERRAFEAEREALNVGAHVSSGQDRDVALAAVQRAAQHVSPRHRLAYGQTTFGIGCALQASGRTAEAIRFLTAAAEREEAEVDAGSIRALGGLMFVHRQAGNMRACEDVSAHVLDLTTRNGLPVAAGWARWKLGWIAYWRDDLEQAIAHLSAIVADARRVHLHCACEAMCGLALAWQAKGMRVEAADIMRDQMELILDANALEYLPLVRGFEARLALLRGEPERAIAWLELRDGIAIESNGLDAFDHPYLTRVKALLGDGSARRLDDASQAIAAFLAWIEARNHGAHLIEALALSALVLDAQGRTDEALQVMRRSVSLAGGAGWRRVYSDLGPAAAALLCRLAAQDPGSPFLMNLIAAFEADRGASQDKDAPELRGMMLEIFTPREAEVLQGLARRLSYHEIGSELFISMETVKSHVASIYGKLQVNGRREALAKAEALGWLSPT